MHNQSDESEPLPTRVTFEQSPNRKADQSCTSKFSPSRLRYQQNELIQSFQAFKMLHVLRRLCQIAQKYLRLNQMLAFKKMSYQPKPYQIRNAKANLLKGLVFSLRKKRMLREDRNSAFEVFEEQMLQLQDYKQFMLFRFATVYFRIGFASLTSAFQKLKNYRALEVIKNDELHQNGISKSNIQQTSTKEDHESTQKNYIQKFSKKHKELKVKKFTLVLRRVQRQVLHHAFTCLLMHCSFGNNALMGSQPKRGKLSKNRSVGSLHPNFIKAKVNKLQYSIQTLSNISINGNQVLTLNKIQYKTSVQCFVLLRTQIHKKYFDFFQTLKKHFYVERKDENKQLQKNKHYQKPQSNEPSNDSLIMQSLLKSLCHLSKEQSLKHKRTQKRQCIKIAIMSLDSYQRRQQKFFKSEAFFAIRQCVYIHSKTIKEKIQYLQNLKSEYMEQYCEESGSIQQEHFRVSHKIPQYGALSSEKPLQLSLDQLESGSDAD